jgi:hypothetical protein
VWEGRDRNRKRERVKEREREERARGVGERSEGARETKVHKNAKTGIEVFVEGSALSCSV